MTKLESVKAKIIEAVPEIAGRLYFHGAECLKCKKGSRYGSKPDQLISGDSDFTYGTKGNYRLNHHNCGGEVVRVGQEAVAKREIYAYLTDWDCEVCNNRSQVYWFEEHGKIMCQECELTFNNKENETTR